MITDKDEALDNWATIFSRMCDFADSFYEALTFTEAEALARLLYVAGEPALAVTLVEQWAQLEEEGEVEEIADLLNETISEYKQHPNYESETE